MPSARKHVFLSLRRRNESDVGGAGTLFCNGAVDALSLHVT